MDIKILDREFNSIISEKVKPEIFKAFGCLITEINDNLSQSSEFAETVIAKKASQIRKELVTLIDLLEEFAIKQIGDQIEQKEESGSQSPVIPEGIQNQQH